VTAAFICGEGPVRGGRGPFLYSWVLFYSWRGCLSPFVSRAGWHTADAGDDRLGSPADKTGSAASFHCSHSLCRAFSPVTAVVSGIAVVRRSNEADAYGLEASCRHEPSVRRWRLMQSLKAEELAERAGISRSTLQKIERGDPGVSIGAVMSVMQALGQIDHVVGSFDPLYTDVGRLCSTETLPSRVRR
jgi:DNA-binding XRE family transcriptional regulator